MNANNIDLLTKASEQGYISLNDVSDIRTVLLMWPRAIFDKFTNNAYKSPALAAELNELHKSSVNRSIYAECKEQRFVFLDNSLNEPFKAKRRVDEIERVRGKLVNLIEEKFDVVEREEILELVRSAIIKSQN